MGRRTESLLPCGSGYCRFQAHSGKKQKEDAGMQEGIMGQNWTEKIQQELLKLEPRQLRQVYIAVRNMQKGWKN